MRNLAAKTRVPYIVRKNELENKLLDSSLANLFDDRSLFPRHNSVIHTPLSAQLVAITIRTGVGDDEKRRKIGVLTPRGCFPIRFCIIQSPLVCALVFHVHMFATYISSRASFPAKDGGISPVSLLLATFNSRSTVMSPSHAGIPPYS